MTLLERYTAAVATGKPEVLRLSQLVEQEKFQIRDGQLDAEHVKVIAAAYAAGEAVERPVVFRVNGVCLLTRGYHRKESAKMAGLTELECLVVDTTDRRLAEVDALRGNDHKAKSMTKAELKTALRRLYDLEVIPKNSTAAAFSRLVNLSADTIEDTLRQHDLKRAGQDERVSSSGRTVNVAKMRTTKKKEEESDDGGDSTPASTPLPPPAPKTTAAVKKGEAEYDGPLVGYGYCLPDRRFMPHVDDAEEMVQFLAEVKLELEAVRRKLKAKFDGRHEVIANRIAWSMTNARTGKQEAGTLQKDLEAMLETVSGNVPDHLCPSCFGVGTDEQGDECRHCDGFGFLDKTMADGLEGLWKKSEQRYEKRAKAAARASAEVSL